MMRVFLIAVLVVLSSCAGRAPSLGEGEGEGEGESAEGEGESAEGEGENPVGEGEGEGESAEGEGEGEGEGECRACEIACAAFADPVTCSRRCDAPCPHDYLSGVAPVGLFAAMRSIVETCPDAFAIVGEYALYDGGRDDDLAIMRARSSASLEAHIARWTSLAASGQVRFNDELVSRCAYVADNLATAGCSEHNRRAADVCMSAILGMGGDGESCSLNSECRGFCMTTIFDQEACTEARGTCSPTTCAFGDSCVDGSRSAGQCLPDEVSPGCPGVVRSRLGAACGADPPNGTLTCEDGLVCRANVCALLVGQLDACNDTTLLCASGACIDGACSATEVCNDDSACTLGRRCAVEQHRCVTPKSAGTACSLDEPCEMGTGCFAGICRVAAAGEHCSTRIDCDDDTWCQGIGSTAVCVARPTAGEACGVPTCAAGLQCADSICQVLPAVGEPCIAGLCGGDARCVDDVCVAARGVGDVCTGDDCSTFSRCTDDNEVLDRRCSAPAARLSEACAPPVTGCALPLQCLEGFCSAPKLSARRLGDVCVPGSVCDTGAGLICNVDGRCERRPATDSCAGGWPCDDSANNRCNHDTGSCVARSVEGSGCSGDLDCAYGLGCFNGICGEGCLAY